MLPSGFASIWCVCACLRAHVSVGHKFVDFSMSRERPKAYRTSSLLRAVHAAAMLLPAGFVTKWLCCRLVALQLTTGTGTLIYISRILRVAEISRRKLMVKWARNFLETHERDYLQFMWKQHVSQWCKNALPRMGTSRMPKTVSLSVLSLSRFLRTFTQRLIVYDCCAHPRLYGVEN